MIRKRYFRTWIAMAGLVTLGPAGTTAAGHGNGDLSAEVLEEGGPVVPWEELAPDLVLVRELLQRHDARGREAAERVLSRVLLGSPVLDRELMELLLEPVRQGVLRISLLSVVLSSPSGSEALEINLDREDRVRLLEEIRRQARAIRHDPVLNQLDQGRRPEIPNHRPVSLLVPSGGPEEELARLARLLAARVSRLYEEFREVRVESLMEPAATSIAAAIERLASEME